MPTLRRLLRDVAPSDTPADLRRALTAAADALHGRHNPMIVLIGDGAYDEETLAAAVWDRPGDDRLDAIDLSGIDVRYLPVGKTAENVGIVAFNVRRYIANKMSYEVFIEIENFGNEIASRKLVLYSGDNPIDVRRLELAPGERLRQIYPDLSGGDDHRLRAELERDSATPGDAEVRDAFPLDDVAWALLPERKRQDVLLVTRDNLYLEGAMLVYDNVRVDKLTPDEYDREAKAGALPPYTAVVFDGHAPATLPPEPTHLMYFDAKGPAAPFRRVRSVRGPRVTEVDPDHPVTRWLVMNDVNFDEVDVLEVDRKRGEVVLARSVRDPIMAAKRDGGRKIVACGFSLAGTDLMMRVAFPLLLVNTLDWFASDDADLITTYRTGTRVLVPMDATAEVAEAEVRAPGGAASRAPLVDGRATFYAAEVGIHTVVARAGGQVLGEMMLAANLASPSESDIEPSSELNLGGRTLSAPEGFSVTRRQALWSYLVLAALALLAVEWLTYHRRVTV
jgi:Ca-activated chloride channel homolog